MPETINLPVIESFLYALRPSGPWTLTAIHKTDDDPPDLLVVVEPSRTAKDCGVHG